LARSNLICGIDIGNTFVKTIIAEIDREQLRPRVVGLASVPSNGLRRGVVVDMEETMANIRDSVEQASAMGGVKINRAYVSINGAHIRSQMSRGVIAVARADNEISQNDIDRVIDAAAAISLPPNREIIHIIPKRFVIDNQENVKNPLGMKGVRLEADVLLIEGLSPYIRNLARCINGCDIEVAEFVFTPLAAAKSSLDKHQIEHGVMSIDFGGGISTLAFFHEGEMIHSATLPIGSRHITNDLAIALRTTMDSAEEIKCLYGYTGPNETLSKDQVDLSEFTGGEGTIVPKKQLAKIIDARISELFDLITAEVRKVPSDIMLPAGVVLIGGGAALNGLPNLTKSRMRLSVNVGISRHQPCLIDGIRDRLNDPSLSTALGLVIWGFEKEFSTHGEPLLVSSSRSGLSKVGRWLKNFLP
jgi:cell division protein FtsA